MVDTLGDELGEDDGGARIAGGVADVFLRRGSERSDDDELFARGIVGGSRGDVGDVGAVSDLGHGE